MMSSERSTSSSPPERLGRARWKWSATSSTRGSNSGSNPGKMKAISFVELTRRGSAVNQTSLRPRHGVPRSTILRARARVRVVGSTIASRTGPSAGAAGAVEAVVRSRSSATDSWRERSSVLDPARRRTRSPGAVAVTFTRGRGREVRHPGASSRTTWALMPPKPKALTPARRGLAMVARSHCSSSVTGRKRVGARAGWGSSTCSVGGRTPWCTARAALISPAMPAAGMAWPMLDFTVPRPTSSPPRARPPKARATVSSSVWSPAGVAVPWASSRPRASAAVGSRAASVHACSTASSCPAERGLMRLEARPSLATPVPRMTA